MVSCEQTSSYKVALRACQNSVIDHNLVTIGLSLEWPERGGDDPSLVINITNKQPSPSYLQPNPSSVHVNSVHHHHPYPENPSLAYQQPYYHSSAPNNHDPTSSTIAANIIGDHNEYSSTTTTTVVYNTIQPQIRRSSSPAAIQKIASHLKSQLSPNFRCQPTLNQQYLSSQHVIQAPSNNINDNRLDMHMSTISPSSSMKSMPPVMTQFSDLQQPSTMTCSSSMIKPLLKSLICTCPYPTIPHVPSCAVFAFNNQESNTNLLSETIHRPTMNRTTPSPIVSASQTPPNGAISISSMKEPITRTTFISIPNSNPMKTLDSSSGVTTIISQPSSFLNHTQLGSTIKTSSLDPGNIFQHSVFNFPQSINSYQSNSSIPIPNVEQPRTTSNNPPRQRKPSTKRNSLTNQDQNLSIQTSPEQPIHFLNNQNSPARQQNINPPSLLSSPIQTQQGMFILPDNCQMTDNSGCVSSNDIKVKTPQQQQSPHTNQIRSPVKLDIPTSQILKQPKLSSEAIMDQTISEVVDGKVDISLHNSSITTASQQQKQKPSLASQLVWESNGPSPTTRTYLSPSHQKQQSSIYDSTISTLNHQNVVDITQQVIRPNLLEQNQLNTLSTTKNKKKKSRAKSTTNSELKRTKKTIVNTRQQIIISSSHQDISQTRTSPITSTSNAINRIIPWIDTPVSSSSSGGVTNVRSENSNQHLTNDSLQMTDIGLSYSVFDDEPMQIVYSLHDQHPLEFEELFSSTPPLASTSVSETISSANTDMASLSDPSTIYQNYFPTHPLSSLSPWEENQATTSVLTSPDPQNNHLPQEQYYSDTNTFSDSNLQSQTLTSQFIETNSNSVNSMNNNDDVQTSSKEQEQQQQTKTINKSSKQPSKISKQRHRPKPIQKSSSIKPTCTRCGLTQLIDITRHEFPKQKGLVFECAHCGNNSIRSNVSADERRRRLAKVAADHLNTIVCQFCHKYCHSHNDYLVHLKDDHGSNKPM